VKRTRGVATIALACLCVFSGGGHSRAATQNPVPPDLGKLIAIVPFGDVSDRAVWEWKGPDPGRSMSDMLAAALQESGKLRVVEPAELDRVLAERGAGSSGGPAEPSAPELGRLLGAEAVVSGRVTEFGYASSGAAGRTSGAGEGITGMTARVAVDVRMVDTVTGETILTDTSADSKSRVGASSSGGGLPPATGAGADSTLIGEAARTVVQELVAKIEASLAGVPWTGRVVKASGGSVYLNAGTDAGIESGMAFAVYRRTEGEIDRETGLALGAAEEFVGRIRVSEVHEKYSVCEIMEGSGFAAADVVRFE
jgi:curli biogenesis system outer membrane secretion channel CsgG